MAPENRDRDPFLAAIEAKIAAWTAVADSYRNAVSLDGPLGDMGGAAAPQGQPKGHAAAGKPMDLPVGVFRDKTIREAISIYLAAGHRKQTNKEIATGLQRGGIATTSANFEATVATALHRMKEEGLILRFPDGWDLASQYPDSLRARLEKDAKPSPKKAKGKATAKRGAKAPTGPKAIYIKVKKAPAAPAADSEDLKAVG